MLAEPEGTTSNQSELPPGASSQTPPEVPLPSGWSLYSDNWYGFTIHQPPGWKVKANEGRIYVTEPTTIACAAFLWPTYLSQPLPVHQVAQEFVGILRKIFPGLQVWQQESTQPETRQLSLRIKTIIDTLPVEGYYSVTVEGENALVSGFYGSSQMLEKYHELFGQILSSFKPIAVLPKQLVQEPSEGAFGALIPEGWSYTASTSRNSGFLGAIQFTAQRDTRSYVMVGVPNVSWQYIEGNPSLNRQSIPGGPQYLPYMTAYQYCQQVLPQWLQRFNPDLQVEGIEDLRGLSNALRTQATAAGMPTEFSNAKLTTTYNEAGQQLRHKTSIGLTRSQPPQNTAWGFPRPSIWSVTLSNYYRTPIAEFSQLEPILEGILASIIINPQWQQSEVTRSQNNMANAFEQRLRQGEELAEVNRQMYENQRINFYERMYQKN